jgi:toxin CcdB
LARFDIYRHEVGLIVDVQTDILDGLTTRMMAPLVPLVGAPKQVGRLNPILEIEGELYVLQPQLMTAIAERQLDRPVGNILNHYDRIVAAIDMVFNGF